MGDKRLYFDEYENKQYYLDENGDPVYLESEPSDKKSDTSVKVAVIGGVFAVIVALISIIPLFPRETPSGETEYESLICIAFNCGNQTNNIEIAVAATLTAVAPTPLPTEMVPTINLSATPTNTQTATPQIQPTQTPAIVIFTATVSPLTQIPLDTPQPTQVMSSATPVNTLSPTQPFNSSIPTGLAQFDDWSIGVYASEWLQDQRLLTDASAEVREQQNQAYSFEVYIDSRRVATHGYRDGGIFWDHDSRTCKYVPLDTVTTVTIHAGSSIWGMGIDTSDKDECR